VGWEISREKCLRCGACVAVCPMLSLELNERQGVIHNRKTCNLCGICQRVCPAGAIGVKKDA
jgi:NAD-dependent dihydropyrimidine dehydrogenase PreA subunit